MTLRHGEGIFSYRVVWLDSKNVNRTVANRVVLTSSSEETSRPPKHVCVLEVDIGVACTRSS